MEAIEIGRAVATRDAPDLARLRDQAAVVERIDPHAIGQRIPRAADIVRDLDGAGTAIVARTPRSDPVGYGLVRSWDESDGTQVHLLDVWARPGLECTVIEQLLFEHLEKRVRDDPDLAPTAVLGANARDTESARMRLLERLDYRRVFEMVEMELHDRPASHSLPPGITTRTVTSQDAEAIAELTARVWAGRRFFRALQAEEVRRWLADADYELFLLAEELGALVGLTAATITDRYAELDDLQVDPRWQRRGIASALLSGLLSRIAERTRLPVRLLTEGDDPAGALTLYARLGFQVVAVYGRYRKPITAV